MSKRRFFRFGALNGLLLIFFLVFLPNVSQATHIRAGEIIAQVVDCAGLRYKFTIIGYTDTGSDVQFGGGEIDFGDGSDPVAFDTRDFKVRQDLGDEIAKVVFEVEHAYPSSGEYIISFREFNRNAGVLNMINSVETPFYIETKLLIDSFIPCNESVNLLIPPVDKAAVGVTYVHNPGAWDPEGDSLSYEIVINKQERDKEVNGYRFPNDPLFGGTVQGGTAPAEFRMDPVTGDLVWDAPGTAGEYNIAFRVYEWRLVLGTWVQLGYVTRDMQIIVEDTDNEPPEILLPPDTCIVAGELLQAEITATDPDGHPIQMTAHSGIFELRESDRATYSPNDGRYQTPPGKAKLDIEWTPLCKYVRNRPYDVVIKAKDNPGATGVPLATFETWRVTVVAPKPELISAEQVTGNKVRVRWEDYTEKFGCGATRTERLRTKVYRKVGPGTVSSGDCKVGLEDGSGYVLVGEANAKDRLFDDDVELVYGATYCYRIVMEFTDEYGGTSFVSDERCVTFEEDDKTAAVITNVDIDKVNNADGDIIVRWTLPYDVDPAKYPGPYTYDVYRRNLSSLQSTWEKIVTTDQLEYRDKGLDTQTDVYQYYIATADKDGQYLANSGKASTVQAEMSVTTGAIILTWNATVPWTNSWSDGTEASEHVVYRNQVLEDDLTAFVEIGTVDVTESGLRFTDNGSHNGKPLDLDTEYCYYVLAKGSYFNSPKVPEPLKNRSQIICGSPDDGKPPCAPFDLQVNNGESCEERMSSLPCEVNTFANTLTWKGKTDGECGNDISEYKVYYAPDNDSPFEVLGTSKSPAFVHSDLTSIAGCYYIVAVDRAKNESLSSDTLCLDNCPSFWLPNTFTPNNDDKNETFGPYKKIDDVVVDFTRCPRFVRSLHFKVLTRHGRVIYEFVKKPGDGQDIDVLWDGMSEGGKDVSTGVYHYIVDVTFDVLDPAKRKQTFKGWIHKMK
ncbi:hypothetical protein FUAX_30270 [Fulvitalea axinellae]|uniref:Gliding motility-associated C-terminal domain-containing protein n=1 Tax=Fulvitalea axinellae TaxID=1182444 RepID=A0AAU9CML2_9BACT|nr:hypothetical protein FUAX_30270 [Fulvitalea axinellae]